MAQKLCADVILYGQRENHIKVYAYNGKYKIYINHTFHCTCDGREEVDAEIEAIRCEYGLSYVLPMKEG